MLIPPLKVLFQWVETDAKAGRLNRAESVVGPDFVVRSLGSRSLQNSVDIAAR